MSSLYERIGGEAAVNAAVVSPNQRQWRTSPGSSGPANPLIVSDQHSAAYASWAP